MDTSVRVTGLPELVHLQRRHRPLYAEECDRANKAWQSWDMLRDVRSSEMLQLGEEDGV